MSRPGSGARREPQPWDPEPRVTPAIPFERSARFWLGAYPRRWRELHGDEVVGVLEDTARGDGGELPARLPRAEALGLLRAGWALRWREHPGFGRWLLYRTWNRRLQATDWPWVVDDIRGRWFPVVFVLGRVWFFLPLWLYLAVIGGPGSSYRNPWLWAGYVAVLIVMAWLGRHQQRRGEWARHVVHGETPWDSVGPDDGAMRVGGGRLPSSAGRMTPGVDPAITGEPPEERPRT